MRRCDDRLLAKGLGPIHSEQSEESAFNPWLGKSRSLGPINKIGPRDDGRVKFFSNMVKVEEPMRKPKWNALILTSALALTFLGTHAAAAPQPGKQSQSEQATKKEAAADQSVYRVIYKVSELENGKTVNSRSYTMTASADKLSSTRIGSRIPYSTGNGFQYQDVGMDIDCQISKVERNLVVRTNLDMTTVASNEATPASAAGLPVLRHLRLQDYTFALLGKPALVGSIDDIASNRHYEIVVTVTDAK